MKLLAEILNNRTSLDMQNYDISMHNSEPDVNSIDCLHSVRFAVIEECPDGVFLYTYDLHGEFIGDTWHMSIDDAKKQALYQFGDFLQPWSDVPPHVHDVMQYALHHL